MILLDNLELQTFNDNFLYFSDDDKNQFTTNLNRLNDNIIISKDVALFRSLFNFHNFLKDNLNYLDVTLFNFINLNYINYKKSNIYYKLLLYRCSNIIAISGDSGSGKSTLSKCLKYLYSSENCLLLETDRYHKWERGNENYNYITHLNPEANNLEKLSEDVYNLKIGNEIYQVDYNHETGKFTNKERIESKQNIILTGLHTLFNYTLNPVFNLKIFINIQKDLVKSWKLKRDVEERGYHLEKVLAQINKRLEDYEKYILIQKDNADVMINFFKDKCDIEILNQYIINKIIKYLTLNNYNFFYKLDNLVINLKNEKPNFKFEYSPNIFLNNYYMEIFCIIYEILN